MYLRALLFGLLFSFCNKIVLGATPNLVVTVKKVDDTFIVDAAMSAPVKLQTAWNVLNDYERMHEYVENLRSSHIFMREGNVMRIRDTGVAKFGVLSFEYQSEREIRLEPMKRMFAKSLSVSVNAWRAKQS